MTRLPALEAVAARTSPFANGSEFGDWCASNCDKCAKAADPDSGRASTCSIFDALHEAFFSDGTVSEEIAERMGSLDHRPPRAAGFYYGWPCPEHDPAFENAAGHCERCKERSARNEQQK